jgi:hypothetical protein
MSVMMCASWLMEAGLYDHQAKESVDLEDCKEQTVAEHEHKRRGEDIDRSHRRKVARVRADPLVPRLSNYAVTLP